MVQFEVPAIVPADPEGNVADLLVQRVQKTPDLALFGVPDGAGWRDVSAKDFETAVIEQFRALARSVHNRTVIALSPGMTATVVADAVAAAFPGHGHGLHRAAESFNAARYLGLGASEDDWQHLRGVDAALEAAKPAALTPLAGRAS